MPDVHGSYQTTLQSRYGGGPISNKGTITVDGTAYSLPQDFHSGTGPYSITYNPDPGFVFIRWETSGSVSVSNANAQTTQMTVSGYDGVLTAVYSTSVGGVILPTNTLTVLAPHLAMIGLVATAATAFKRKHVY